MKISIKTPFFIFVIFIMVAVSTVFVMRDRARASACDLDYTWINHKLACRESVAIDKASYLAFRNSLNQKIDTWVSDGDIEKASVYFRDLENGPTFGINDRTSYVPANLLKVPVMLTYFKLAEEDQSILEKELAYSEESEIKVAQTIDEEKKLEAGKMYSIDELIYRMIAFSDNVAKEMLEVYLENVYPDVGLVGETYRELGIIDPEGSPEAEVVTAKGYASIFRVLYNASYLNKEFSDKALEYLAYSDYEDGIRGGPPPGVPIAHKFGERAMEDGSRQLHDCGIIYYPENPYLLCVTTKGKDFEKMSNIISNISKAVYEEFDSRKIK